MEYVEGRTLREILNETTVMEADEAARVTEGILDALSYSHRMGIVHRDIKPANVMLTPAGDVKVMDFGIARAIADTAATMTQTQSVIGTAQYLSPEQAQGKQVDARSDLYSAGCLLYELLTGRTPFVGDSPVSVAYQHVGQEPQPPSTYQPGLSADLDAVVLHSLVKDRDGRYQDAAQFRSDLGAARAGRPISAAARGTAAGAAAPGGDPTRAMAAVDPTQAVGTKDTGALAGLGEDPSAEPAKSHRTTYILLALAVVAALVLVALAGRAMFGSTPTPKVAVPTVISLTQTQAVAKLRAVGLVENVSTATNDAAKGTVTDQSPRAGEQVPAKTKVNITVSSGPGEVAVPDVSGFNIDSAVAAIRTAGLVPGQVESVDDPTVTRGKVIETVPAANKSVAVGSVVTIKAASGKVKVPNVVGANRSDAQQSLTDARLKYTTKFADSDKPEGTVLAQTHRSETVDVGTQIVLTVAQKPQPTAPPTTAPTTTTPTPTVSLPPAATTAP
jgi:serine/threonine-protein kinase